MKLSNIKTALAKILAQFERVTTDKGILSFDGDELEVGMSVSLVDEEGNESKPEDGEYKTDDGIVYVIADGKCTDIKELEKEDTTGDDVEPQDEIKEEMQKFSLMHRMAINFESFLEKEDKIRAGLVAKGIDGWLVDAGEEYAIVGIWQEATMADKYFKYALTWDEDGNVVIGDSIEVKPAYVPVEDEQPAAEEAPVEEKFEDEEPEEDPKDEQIKNLEAEVARLEEENGELKERINELENKPAAEPAEEEFEKITKTEKTGNKRLDNLNRILNA